MSREAVLPRSLYELFTGSEAWLEGGHTERKEAFLEVLDNESIEQIQRPGGQIDESHSRFRGQPCLISPDHFRLEAPPQLKFTRSAM